MSHNVRPPSDKVEIDIFMRHTYIAIVIQIDTWKPSPALHLHERRAGAIFEGVCQTDPGCGNTMHI
jgi:hypothetical protein